MHFDGQKSEVVYFLYHITSVLCYTGIFMALPVLMVVTTTTFAHKTTMTVHSIHVFDRKGKTLFTKRFAKGPPENGNEEQLSEQRKLVFGMLFSLREIVASLAPETEIRDKGESRTTAPFSDA
jgi:hypothetical protein